MAKRFPTNYSTIEDLEFLTSEDLHAIENKAACLALPDCLDFLSISLDDLTPIEKDYIIRAHKRGRALAIAKAGDKLFNHMASRAGGQSALAYLSQMSGTFKANITPAPGAGSGFSFNVIMNDEK